MPLCLHCEEPLEAGRQELHHECQFRLVAGSVAHIEKRCGCYVPGSTEGDPPGMKPREAAQAALRAFFKQKKRHQGAICNGSAN